MAKKSLKRGLAQKIVLSLLTASVMASVLAFEIAEAGNGDFAANGDAMVMDGTEFSNKKIIGGWDVYHSNFDSSTASNKYRLYCDEL